MSSEEDENDQIASPTASHFPSSAVADARAHHPRQPDLLIGYAAKSISHNVVTQLEQASDITFQYTDDQTYMLGHTILDVYDKTLQQYDPNGDYAYEAEEGEEEVAAAAMGLPDPSTGDDTRKSERPIPQFGSVALARYFRARRRYANSSTAATTASSEAPAPKRKYNGYSPAIHGNYDPNADYGRKEEERHPAQSKGQGRARRSSQETIATISSTKSRLSTVLDVDEAIKTIPRAHEPEQVTDAINQPKTMSSHPEPNDVHGTNRGPLINIIERVRAKLLVETEEEEEVAAESPRIQAQEEGAT